MTIHFHYEIVNHLLDWLEKCELDREPVLESHHQKPTKNNQDQLQFTSLSSPKEPQLPNQKMLIIHWLALEKSPKNHHRIWRDRDTSLNKTQFQTPGNEHRISQTMTCHDPGWWLTYPSEKYESQMGLLFPIYGKSFKSPWFQTTNVYHHGKTCKLTCHDHCSSSHHQASPRRSPPRVPSSVLLGSSTSYAPDPREIVMCPQLCCWTYNQKNYRPTGHPWTKCWWTPRETIIYMYI